MGLHLVMTDLLRNFVYKVLENFSRGYQAFRSKEYKINQTVNGFTRITRVPLKSQLQVPCHTFYWGWKLSLFVNLDGRYIFPYLSPKAPSIIQALAQQNRS